MLLLQKTEISAEISKTDWENVGNFCGFMYLWDVLMGTDLHFFEDMEKKIFNLT